MKKMKKVLSLVLALALVFGLSATAFAANSSDTYGSITIDGAIANETYTIYQIFDLTYTSDETGANTGDSYSYKVNDEWINFLDTQTTVVGGQVTGLFTLTDNNYLDPDSLIFQAEELDVDMAALAQDALSYAVDTEISGTSASFAWSEDDGAYVVTSTSENVTIGTTYTDDYGYVYADLTFSNLSLGYYLVGTSLGSLCMLDSTDPNAMINEKNSTPILSKHVYNTSDETYEQEDHENNNTLVSYELDVDNITGAVNLVIHDSQPSEIEENWNNFHPAVTLVDGESRTALIENTDYVINLTGAVDDNSVNCSDEAFDEAYGCTFEIDFTGYDFSNVSEAAYIEVIYTGMLETEGDIYEGDVDEIDNWAVVTFGQSSTSPIVEAEVYSFGFEVYKYTGAEYEGSSYQYVITDSATYDINAGGDTYCLAYLDSDTETVYYAIFNLGDWDLDSNAEFVITGWTTEISEATTWDEGTEDVTVILTFYTNSMPNNNADSHIVEIMEIEGDSSIDPQEFEGEENASSVSEDGTHPLANAVFEVRNASGQTAYFLYEEDLGIYLFEGWGTIPEGYENVYTTSLTSTTNGMIYIEGLDTGTYTVTEIAAPDGYNMLDDSITVTIWATYDETSGAIIEHGVKWVIGDDDMTEDNIDMGAVNVLNNSGNELPSTGGIGTTWFYIIGAILVCGAAVVLVTRRRVNTKAA